MALFKPFQRQMLRQIGRHTPRTPYAPLSRSYASSAAEPFDWRDPLKASNMFTEEELAIAETAEQYCQEQMLPRVLGSSSTTITCGYH